MFLCFTYIEIIIFPYEITLKFSKIFNTSFVFFICHMIIQDLILLVKACLKNH